MDIFPTMKARLDEKVGAFKEHLDAAAEARQVEIDVQLAQARARAETTRAALDTLVPGARAAVETGLAALRRAIQARRPPPGGPDGTIDATRAGSADADADDAENYARCVFDMALCYLDEAEVGALAASYAEDRAHVLRHETADPAGLSGTPAAAPAPGVADRIAAVYDQVVGSAKHDLGKATHDARLAAEGAAQEARGHVEWAVGRQPPTPPR